MGTCGVCGGLLETTPDVPDVCTGCGGGAPRVSEEEFGERARAALGAYGAWRRGEAE